MKRALQFLKWYLQVWAWCARGKELRKLASKCSMSNEHVARLLEWHLQDCPKRPA